MAVELRCPECRAQLRLKRTPEPDSEIECPECGKVFTTDDNFVHAGDADDERPAKKKPAKAKDDGESEKEQKKSSNEDKKKDKPKPADEPFKRKKRRAKKKKTNPAVLWSVLGGTTLLLLVAGGMLIWMMNRKTFSQEMMSYLPDDCDEVSGINIGHLQKYPAFYKSCEASFANKGFKKAADVFAKAVGGETADILDYVIQGEGKPNNTTVEATVLRTKAEYDTSVLSKMPGAKEYTAEGVKYYTIDDIPALNYPGLRVFAPTNRLVVFCRGDMPEGKFRAMLTGNKDNQDGVVYKRAGPLIKGVTRGTAWKFTLYGRSMPRPAPPPPPVASNGGSVQESEEDALKKVIAEITASAQGAGYKASVGSRDVRGEWVVWMKDSDAAYSLAKKWKDLEWVKDDEKPRPRWWKLLAQKSGGGKTADNAVMDGLGFRSSGETFSIKSSLETKVLGGGVGSLIGTFVQNTAGGGGGPSMPGQGGGRPGPGTPPPPGNIPTPNKRRRFEVIRRRTASQPSAR